MLAGEFKHSQETYICIAISQVGRERKVPERQATEVGDFKHADVPSGCSRPMANLPEAGRISKFGARFANRGAGYHAPCSLHGLL